ncbi:MAG: hypothetical protein IT314_06345 [Anaerolineales bacterium]|nr:hypothetical protein [Anaerolineales bacterium]
MKLRQKGWFWFLVILALIALDQFIFAFFFNLSYFEWYRKNGSLISALFALVSLTWDLNKNIGLVSANPRHYAGAVMQLIGAQIYAFGAIGKTEERKSPDGLKYNVFDNLTFIVLVLALLLLNVFWVILIAPFQYFLVLLLGGPARIYLSAPKKTLIRFEESQLQRQEIPREAEPPKSWLDISIANKPVALTYGMVTLAFLVIGFFLK